MVISNMIVYNVTDLILKVNGFYFAAQHRPFVMSLNWWYKPVLIGD